MAFEL